MASHCDLARFWDCCVGECPKAAAVDIGNCEHCHNHYCGQHVSSSLHKCPSHPLGDEAWEAHQVRELEGLRDQLQIEKLLSEASAAKGGVACALDTTDPLGRRRMGGMHVHLRILFTDGSAWLARIPRRNYTSFDTWLTDEILLSECAVLRWLETVQIPAPRLHRYALHRSPGNDVGSAWMLIDELPGHPFNRYTATKDQAKKVFSQMADVFHIISQHPFKEIGSLTLDPSDNILVGPVTGDRTGTLSQLGPFPDAKAFRLAWVDEYIRLIADGQVCSRYSVNAWLMFKHLRELAGRDAWDEDGYGSRSDAAGSFYLKHMDDKGDHILVDANFNITGIIDWSFARALPAHEAFGPSLLTANLDQLLRGVVGLTEEDGMLAAAMEARCPGLSRFMKGADCARRFNFGIGIGIDLTSGEAIDVFRGLVESLTGHDIGDWPAWRAGQLDKWASDEDDDDAWERAIHTEISELLGRVNVPALVQHASSIAGGRSCSFEEGKYLGEGAMMGCANYHAWLVFDDGTKWLVRIPRMAFSDVPSDLVEYLVEGEYATLKFLETTDVPAPRAYGLGLASDPNNKVGVSYLLLEPLPGKPYQPYRASPEQRRRVLEQMGEVLLTLRKQPFQSAGSLVIVDGNITVGPVASNRFLVLGKYGPFQTESAYYASIAEQYLDLIADGQIYHQYPEEAFLFYTLLQKSIPKLLSDDEGYYLKHVDDKGDHILVDDDYKLVGVIDWQFARVVPAREAFGPSLLTAALDCLYSRHSGLSPDDRALADVLLARGDAELAELMGDGEMIRRFHFGLASGLSKGEAREMIAGLLVALGEEAASVDVESWMERERKLCTGDARWAKVEVLSRELAGG